MLVQLKISSQEEEVDQLSASLEELGALCITYTDKADHPILEPELGTTPLWPEVIIQALFDDASLVDSAIHHLSLTHPHLSAIQEAIPEQDWVQSSMKDFKPLAFGKKLWVCPSWSTPPDPHVATVTLNPGLAFGTGTHPTTALCLSWLSEASLTGKTFIDYGCGSGILSLAALKLGAKKGVAVDLDDQALVATRQNAELNHISEQQLEVCKPDGITFKADLLMANILLKPLLSLKETFHGLLSDKGLLVVSGLMTDQMDDLVAAYQPLFTLQSRMVQEEWGLIVFDRQKF